jgi:hypothetical protein
MPGTPETANLPAGSTIPHTGIYVVTHLSPPHAPPHEVQIASLGVFQKCNTCADVRFSLKSYLIEFIRENQFFTTSD